MLSCSRKLRLELFSAWTWVKERSPSEGIELSNPQLAAVHLHQFLKKCLMAEEPIWYELVLVLLLPHGGDSDEDAEALSDEFQGERSRSDSSIYWLQRCERSGFRWLELSMISALKKDWYDDFLEKERRDLAITVDQKRSQLVQDDSTDDVDPKWRKIQLSAELVDLYETVKDNLDECNSHRTSAKKDRVTTLIATKVAAERSIAAATEDIENSRSRQSNVQTSTEELDALFKPRLDGILEERTAIDFKIAALEEQKHKLKLELERVSQELVEAQAAQRDAMDYESQVRSELTTSKLKLSQMLNKEKADQGAYELDCGLNAKLVKLVNSFQESSEDAYQKKSIALGEVYSQFDNAFIEAVQEHMSTLADCIQDIFRRIKRLSDESESIKRSRNAQSVTQLLHSSFNGNETEEFSATAERLDVKLSELSERLTLQASQLEIFDNTFNEFYKRFGSKLSSNRLIRGEVDKIRFVYNEADKVMQKYVTKKQSSVLRGPELLVEEIPESPREDLPRTVELSN